MNQKTLHSSIRNTKSLSAYKKAQHIEKVQWNAVGK